MAHKTDVAESTEKLSSAFAGRLAVGANDGCKALGISKTKWFELRKADPTFPSVPYWLRRSLSRN